MSFETDAQAQAFWIFCAESFGMIYKIRLLSFTFCSDLVG